MSGSGLLAQHEKAMEFLRFATDALRETHDPNTLAIADETEAVLNELISYYDRLT